MTDARIDRLRNIIRDVPDFPKPGILFKDITPLLLDHRAFKTSIDVLCESVSELRPTVVAGIESRGFIFGTPVAERLGIGFVPVRKPGKLPHKTVAESYELEYGTDTLELHADAVSSKDHVVVIDDLLATGGTLAATCRLIEQLGARIVACRTLIELSFLDGRSKIGQRDFASVITY